MVHAYTKLSTRMHPCGQFQGCLRVAMFCTIFSIFGRASAVPIMTADLFSQVCACFAYVWEFNCMCATLWLGASTHKHIIISAHASISP